MGTGRVLSTGTRLRVAVAVIILLVNTVHGSSFTVLPWALLVIGADLVTGAVLASAPLRPRDRRVLGVTITIAAAAVAGLALTAGAGGLLLIVIPLFRAGETWGRKAFAACLPAFLIPAVLAWAASVMTVPDLQLSSLVVWAALALALAGAASWSEHLAPEVSLDDRLASEAAWLLNRLETLASELRGGFDPATSAEHLLDDLPNPGSRARSTLLIGAPNDRPVPLALRGSLRVPWSDPREDDGVLGHAWFDGRPGVAEEHDGRTLWPCRRGTPRSARSGCSWPTSTSQVWRHRSTWPRCRTSCGTTRDSSPWPWPSAGYESGRGSRSGSGSHVRSTTASPRS